MIGTAELILIPIVLLLYIIPLILFFAILYYVVKKAVKNGIKEAENR